MKIFKRIVIVLLVLSALGTIGYLARKQILKRVLPAVEEVVIENIQVIGDSAFVKVQIMVKNHGWTSYELNYTDITLSNDTLVLVHYVNDSVQKLEKNEVRILPISFVVPIKDAIRRIRNLQDRDSTTISVRGFVNVTTMFGNTSREFSKDLSVEVPTPPKIKLVGMTYLGETKTEGGHFHDFRMKVKVANYNSKQFWFKNVSYYMNAGKQIKSSGKIPGDIRILPMDSVVLDIPFRVKVEKEVTLVYKILINDDIVTYNLNITGTVASLAGLQQDIPATFTTSGQVELYDPDRKSNVKITRKRDKKKK